MGRDRIAEYALGSNGMSGPVLMCKISCSVRPGEVSFDVILSFCLGD
jgi:hypothetical protein